MELNLRVGTFFLLAGIGLLLLFVGSVMGKEINVLYLFFGFIALFIGFMLRRKKPPVENTRFAYFRKMNERNSQRRQERENKKKQDREKKR